MFKSCCVLLLFLMLPVQAETVRYPAIEDPTDHRSTYAISLLELALKKAGSTATLQSTAVRVSRSRALYLLETGVEVDVVWTMTSVEREKRFLPVRIPIYKGLGSYRVLLIRSDDQPKFSALQTYCVTINSLYWKRQTTRLCFKCCCENVLMRCRAVCLK